MKKSVKKSVFDAVAYSKEVAQNLFKKISAGAELVHFKAKSCINESIVFISESMSGKMEGIIGISTSNLLNSFCDAHKKIANCICKFCFAETTVSQYRAHGKQKYGLLEHMAENYVILNNINLEEAGEVPIFKPSVDVARFESFGDLQSIDQALNYLRIAIANPHVTFAIWTKNPFILTMAFCKIPKPANLICIISSYMLNETANYSKFPWADHVFTVWENEKAAQDAGVEINCRAIVNGEKVDRCRKCMRCYTRGNKEFFINELKK